MRQTDKKQIIFYHDKGINFPVEKEFQQLWRNTSVDGLQDDNIEEYLNKQASHPGIFLYPITVSPWPCFLNIHIFPYITHNPFVRSYCSILCLHTSDSPLRTDSTFMFWCFPIIYSISIFSWNKKNKKKLEVHHIHKSTQLCMSLCLLVIDSVILHYKWLFLSN